MAKRTKKSKVLNRVNEDLGSGREQWTYFNAVLIALGMLTAKGAAGPGVRYKILRAFHNSGSAISHHTKNGNLIRDNEGAVKLSAKGAAKFHARFSDDSRQHIGKAETAKMVKAIKSGKDSDLPAEWSGTVTFSPVELG